ncbi:MAG: MFS transporter [Desulfobacterales bacterium]|nr:MFS transporter [Desulfobacterales bacterium]
MKQTSIASSYGGVITLSCFSIQAIGVGIYISYGVFFNPLMEAFGWSRAAISGASSVAFFIAGIIAILIGRLNDRFGPRLLMSIAAVFYGLGFGLTSQVETLLGLYLVFGLIYSIGLASIDVIALTTITRWFSASRGKMTGLVKVGTGFGQFAFTMLASLLIAHLGFRNAFAYMGGGAFILLLVIAQFMRRDPEAYYKNGATPDPVSGNPVQTDGMSFSDALRTTRLWLLCFANLLLVFCLLSIMVHTVAHGRDIGIPAHQAAGVLACIGAVSMAGRFFGGLLIDRVGSKKLMVTCFVLLLSSLAWLLRADTITALYTFAVVYGIAHGGFFTAISPIVAELFGIRAHGSLFGMVVAFGTTGGALGPFLTGLVYDLSGSYTLAFWMLILMSAISFALILALRVPARTEG